MPDRIAQHHCRGLDIWPVAAAQGGSNVVLALAAHVSGLVLVAGLVWAGVLPALAVVPFVVLLARAVWLLSPSALSISTRALGFSELGLGAFTVVMVAAGYGLAL